MLNSRRRFVKGNPYFQPVYRLSSLQDFLERLAATKPESKTAFIALHTTDSAFAFCELKGTHLYNLTLRFNNVIEKVHKLKLIWPAIGSIAGLQITTIVNGETKKRVYPIVAGTWDDPEAELNKLLVAMRSAQQREEYSHWLPWHSQYEADYWLTKGYEKNTENIYKDIHNAIIKKLLEVIPQNKDQHITLVEYGCGDGSLLSSCQKILSEQGHRNLRLLGFDINAGAIKKGDGIITNNNPFISIHAHDTREIISSFTKHQIAQADSFIVVLFSGAVNRKVLNGTRDGLDVLQQLASLPIHYAIFSGITEPLINSKMAREFSTEVTQLPMDKQSVIYRPAFIDGPRVITVYVLKPKNPKELLQKATKKEHLNLTGLAQPLFFLEQAIIKGEKITKVTLSNCGIGDANEQVNKLIALLKSLQNLRMICLEVRNSFTKKIVDAFIDQDLDLMVTDNNEQPNEVATFSAQCYARMFYNKHAAKITKQNHDVLFATSNAVLNKFQELIAAGLPLARNDQRLCMKFLAYIAEQYRNSISSPREYKSSIEYIYRKIVPQDLQSLDAKAQYLPDLIKDDSRWLHYLELLPRDQEAVDQLIAAAKEKHDFFQFQWNPNVGIQASFQP